MHVTSALTIAAGLAIASSSAIEDRASCPDIHIFGARESTVSAGYGSAKTFIDLINGAYPGSTSEAIVYPAAGGTNAAYASSVQNGTQSIANQINSFNEKCPSARLVVVGYSQVLSFFFPIVGLQELHLLTDIYPGRPYRRQCSLRRGRSRPGYYIHRQLDHICSCHRHPGCDLGG